MWKLKYDTKQKQKQTHRHKDRLTDIENRLVVAKCGGLEG